MRQQAIHIGAVKSVIQIQQAEENALAFQRRLNTLQAFQATGQRDIGGAVHSRHIHAQVRT